MENNTDDNHHHHNNSNNEEYVIQTKVCKRLSIELKDRLCLQEVEIDPNETEPCVPPEKYGLENSPVIIPAYYKLHKHPYKALSFDYFMMIKDDIRNFRKLSEHQLIHIKGLDDKKKYELIELFNEVSVATNEILSQL